MTKTTCRESQPLGGREVSGKCCEKHIDAKLAAVNGGMAIIIKKIYKNKERQWKPIKQKKKISIYIYIYIDVYISK